MEKDTFTTRDYFFLAALLILIGFITGLIIQEGNFVDFDNKIRYSELLNWLTTIFIGIYFGFVLKNKSEKNKKIADYLCKDIENIIDSIQNVQKKTLISNINTENVYTSDERNEIQNDLHLLDRKITLLVNFLKDCNLLKSSIRENIEKQVINCYVDYNSKITNDKFYSQYDEDYINEIRDYSNYFQMEMRKKLLIVMK